MDWFYSDAGQQKGPVTAEQLSQLVAQGVIRADTLVWRDGMAAWQPYSQVSDPSLPQAQAAKVICSQCGRTFDLDQTFRHGELDVCVECKPAYLQRVKEGVSTAKPAGNAAEMLNAPSLLMMINAGLCLVVVLLALLINLGVMSIGGLNTAGGDRMMMMFQGGFGIANAIVGIVLHILVIMGAMRMRKLQSHKWAMAASVICLVTTVCGGSCCCLFNLGLGIWALVLLTKPEVRSAFPDS